MAMIGKVRRMHCREKKSVREIARLTSLSRNTVRKWLRAPVRSEPKYRRGDAAEQADAVPRARSSRRSKADAHRPQARAAHGASAARADQGRRLRRRLHAA